MTKLGQIWQGIKFSSIGITAAALSKFNQDRGTRYLLQTLAKHPGLPAKAAQLMSMKLGRDLEEFEQDVTALPIEHIRDLILQEAPKLAAEISEISERGQIASLGQVHWARLKDGRETAIKVQLPGVKTELTRQLNLFINAGEFSPAKKYGLDFTQYHQFFETKLSEELDYLNEARIQQIFYEDWKSDSSVVIPKIYPEFCTSAILVQSYEPSAPLAELIFSDSNIREWISKVIARFMFHSVFVTHHLHADFHPRNWGFRPDTGCLVVYDFGSFIEITKIHSQALSMLVQGSQDQNQATLFQAFKLLDFNSEKMKQISPQLPELCRELLTPFVTLQPWLPEKNDLNASINRILGPKKWHFRTAGPTWFLYLMRSFLGLAHSLEKLAAAVPMLEIFDAERIQAGIKLNAPSQSPEKSSTVQELKLARHLYVLVKEGAEEIVWMEMPVASVDCLEDLMPEDTRFKIEAQGYNLIELKNKVRINDYLPQTILETKISNRTYKVWLE